MAKTRTVRSEQDDLFIQDLLKLDQGTDSVTIDRFQYLRHIYRQMPVGIALTVFCSILAAWLIRFQVPHYLLVPWLIFIASTSGLHVILIREFNKKRTHIGTSNNWSVYNTFLCTIVALSWGVGSVLFIPFLSPVMQIMFLGILTIYVIACLPVMAALYSGYLLFISIIAVFLLLCFLYQPVGNKVAVILGLTSVYTFLILIAAYFNRSLLGTFSVAVKLKDNFHYLYDLNELTRNDNIQLRKKIAENKHQHNKLLFEKEQAEITLQSIGEGVITTDTEGYVIYINPVAEVLTGRKTEDSSGEYISELFEIIDETTGEMIDDPVRECLLSGKPVYSGEHTILIRNDKVEYYIDYSVTPIRNKQDIITGTVLVFRDVTDKQILARDLVWQASHDALTGLINRREFENRLIKLINSPNTPDRQHALCYIDLDQFKIVNDSCGHLAGDSLLEKVARKLRGKTRETDTLARLGGDEFGVILYSCSLEKAKLIAEAFRRHVEEIDFVWQEKHFRVGMSIGIVPITNDTNDISELLQLADMACYMAKDNGRNQTHIYNELDHKLVQRHGEMRWVDAIQDALERERFVLYIQEAKPVNENDKTSFCELLLRLKQDNNMDISAAKFIKTAERYHLLPKLDKWTIKACFELLCYGHPVLNKTDIISINISGQSIADERITEYIIKLAGEYEIQPDRICFEIEETSLINNPAAVDRFISILHDSGFHFALDNFSSGLNLLNQVYKLNLDYIKINGHLSGDSRQRIINTTAIDSINKLCHLMGAKTVAKYVSDTDNLKSMKNIGLDYIQGFAISRPASLTNSQKIAVKN